jgi:hypothetical protein
LRDFLDAEGDALTVEEDGTMTAEQFSAAVEALIAKAKASGLSHETLLIEIEDIASLLREGLL